MSGREVLLVARRALPRAARVGAATSRQAQRAPRHQHQVEASVIVSYTFPLKLNLVALGFSFP